MVGAREVRLTGFIEPEDVPDSEEGDADATLEEEEEAEEAEEEDEFEELREPEAPAEVPYCERPRVLSAATERTFFQKEDFFPADMLEESLRVCVLG
jgi:hypothetical protein